GQCRGGMAPPFPGCGELEIQPRHLSGQPAKGPTKRRVSGAGELHKHRNHLVAEVAKRFPRLRRFGRGRKYAYWSIRRLAADLVSVIRECHEVLRQSLPLIPRLTGT